MSRTEWLDCGVVSVCMVTALRSWAILFRSVILHIPADAGARGESGMSSSFLTASLRLVLS